MTTLIIARHGNTFNADDIVRRVGARTDLPLTDSGKEQAKRIGAWLKDNEHYPELVYSSTLQRTRQTAEIALKAAGYFEPVYPLKIFDEIDYGADENKPEEDVVARLGQAALEAWNTHGIVPDGWNADPDQIIQNWQDFATRIIDENEETVLVVTSGGIARFAPHIIDDYAAFEEKYSPKLSTGHVCIFNNDVGGRWHILEWNLKP